MSVVSRFQPYRDQHVYVGWITGGQAAEDDHYLPAGVSRHVPSDTKSQPLHNTSTGGAPGPRLGPQAGSGARGPRLGPGPQAGSGAPGWDCLEGRWVCESAD